MAYQSLYRRYRPRRFAEIRGQEHLTNALRNAVRDDRVGHAYLLSGPRGTGKTTTARVLAKVLNCEAPADGEPCCSCESCLAIEAGQSFDVHELDAASNNKVDDVRDLINKAALGTPGRTKVYILDEVHMLTAAASNALLKTLEEPPDHVVFVLATTDPQKVLATIKSRTQHFTVQLLPAQELRELVEHVATDAELEVDDEAIEYVLRAGGGSARDTLSALDQVTAAGGLPHTIDAVDALCEALCDQDTHRALLAVEQASEDGHNPRILGEALIARLRDVFLASMGSELARLSDRDRQTVADQAERLGPAGTTRALEVLGDAFATIVDAPDQRIPLEVALVRLTRPEADLTLASLAQRIDQLERGQATTPARPTNPADRGSADPGIAGDAPTEPAPPDTAPPDTAPADTAPDDIPPDNDRPDAPTDTAPTDTAPADDRTPTAPSPRARPADGAREQLARKRGQDQSDKPRRRTPPRATKPAAPAPAPTSAPAPEPEPAPSAAPAADRDDSDAAPTTSTSHSPPEPQPQGRSGALPSRDAITMAWGDMLLESLPQRARARFGGGRWHSVAEDAAIYALPNEIHRSRCEDVKRDVEEALAAHFGTPVPLRLIVDDGGTQPTEAARPAEPEDEWVDVEDLDEADPARSHVDRVSSIFPGAELIEE